MSLSLILTILLAFGSSAVLTCICLITVKFLGLSGRYRAQLGSAWDALVAEAGAWCQGCENIVPTKQMKFTDLGLYRCETCRIETPKEIAESASTTQLRVEGTPQYRRKLGRVIPCDKCGEPSVANFFDHELCDHHYKAFPGFGKGHQCVDCGEIIHRGGIQCAACARETSIAKRNSSWKRLNKDLSPEYTIRATTGGPTCLHCHHGYGWWVFDKGDMKTIACNNCVKKWVANPGKIIMTIEPMRLGHF